MRKARSKVEAAASKLPPAIWLSACFDKACTAGEEGYAFVVLGEVVVAPLSEGVVDEVLPLPD